MQGTHIHINKWLLPLSWLYGIGVGIRGKLFDWRILKGQQFDIPTIGIGNITVGGTGKTPHVEYLIDLLHDTFRVATLSRGYKRLSKGYVLAGNSSSILDIGDEPWQIKQKFPNIHVAVDANRCRGIQTLKDSKETSDTQVIILDDAYQHRYVRPGMNILLIDYHRLITHDALLPAGRLREPVSGKERAKIVIVTKCPANMPPMEARVIRENLSLRPFQHLFFSTFAYNEPYPLFRDSTPIYPGNSILLVAGIGNPRQMVEDMRRRYRHVDSMIFGDHSYYCADDLEMMSQRLSKKPEGTVILTTQKDASRLLQIQEIIPETLRSRIWVIPIQVEFLYNERNKFNEKITGYVQKNLRNIRMAQSQDDNKA